MAPNLDVPKLPPPHPLPPLENALWKEFFWGGIAAAVGEGVMHPVDTVKTRMQSGGQFIPIVQRSTGIADVLKSIWRSDGIRGLYRGFTPGVIGSFTTGATYFGSIELSKHWLQKRHPTLSGPVADFFAGIIGDTIGSIAYVPCEVIKQRMQVQGGRKSWNAHTSIAQKSSFPDYMYYKGFLHAGRSIFEQEGARGLYVGYGSTLARDIPFAGLLIVFYDIFSTMRSCKNPSNMKEFTLTGVEDFVMGGLAGGCSAFITTPFDVIKTRLQVQGKTIKYHGWLDAVQKIWNSEGVSGLFRGSLPRISWYVPAYAMAFMTWQGLRNTFGHPPSHHHHPPHLPQVPALDL